MRVRGQRLVPFEHLVDGAHQALTCGPNQANRHLEKTEFAARVAAFSSQVDRAIVRVEDQRTDCDHRVCAAHASTVPNTNSGEQLLFALALGNAIVGAGIQGLDAVGPHVASIDGKDRNLRIQPPQRGDDRCSTSEYGQVDRDQVDARQRRPEFDFERVELGLVSS